jgi:hypothetical protein
MLNVFTLSKYLLLDIFSGWFELDSLTHLDSALCSKAYRQMFLYLLQSASIFRDKFLAKKTSPSFEYYLYLQRRNIKLVSLRFKEIYDESIDDDESSIELISIIDFSHVTSLYFYDGATEGVVKIINSCKRLRELYLHNTPESDDDDENNYDDENDDKGDKLDNSIFEQLSVFSLIFEDDLVQNCSSLLDDSILICKNLTQLTLVFDSENDARFDIQALVQNNLNLRSLTVVNSGFIDEMLHISIWGNNLTSLTYQESRSESVMHLSEVLKHCLKLEYLDYRTFQRVNKNNSVFVMNNKASKNGKYHFVDKASHSAQLIYNTNEDWSPVLLCLSGMRHLKLKLLSNVMAYSNYDEDGDGTEDFSRNMNAMYDTEIERIINNNSATLQSFFISFSKDCATQVNIIHHLFVQCRKLTYLCFYQFENDGDLIDMFTPQSLPITITKLEVRSGPVIHCEVLRFILSGNPSIVEFVGIFSDVADADYVLTLTTTFPHVKFSFDKF